MKETKKMRLTHPDYAANCDVLFALAPLVFMAFYLYGFRPLIMLLIALITAKLCDRGVAFLRRLPYDKTENSSLVYAVVLTLMLPATLPYRMVLAGVAVAVLLGKHIFGGPGSYPFSPAALGYAVITVCWPNQLFSYPKPFSQPGIFSTAGTVLVESSAHALKAGSVPNISTMDLLLGSYAGPMGATFCLVIAAAAIFLLVRRRVDFVLIGSFMTTAALVSLAFPRVLAASRLEILKYEMLSGALLFGAVFLVCNVTTSPKNRTARILYGALTGFLTMMFRYYGAYELGICFAVLLANAFSGPLDRWCSKPHFVQRKVNNP